jgi:hypothetical protein
MLGSNKEMMIGVNAILSLSFATRVFYQVRSCIVFVLSADRIGIETKCLLCICTDCLLIVILSDLCLCQIMFGIGLFRMPDIALQSDSDVSLNLFLTVQFWDYVPTILLLLTIVSRAPAAGHFT